MSDVTILALYPAPEESDVDPSTDIFVSAHTPEYFDSYSFSAKIDGWDTYVPYEQAFYAPDYVGTLQISETETLTYVTARFRPRRPFLYNVKTAINLVVGDVTLNYSFTTRERSRVFQDPALRGTRVESAFSSSVALETYRQALSTGLKKTAGTASVVALVHRVSLSSLRSLLYYVPFAKAAIEPAAGLRGEDVLSLDEATLLIGRLTPLWEVALRELRDMAVPDALIRLLFQAGASLNPSERVGAACFAILLAAQKHVDG